MQGNIQTPEAVVGDGGQARLRGHAGRYLV